VDKRTDFYKIRSSFTVKESNLTKATLKILAQWLGLTISSVRITLTESTKPKPTLTRTGIEANYT